jgi:hypothetical protein
MNALPFIPPRTRAEIASPAPRGQRHEQMKKVSLPLLGAGLAPEAVFAQLRSMYEEDVTDREIRGVITWAALKNPQSCGYPRKKSNVDVRNSPRLATPQQVTTEQAIGNAESWLGNFRCDESDLWHVSPWRPLEDWRLDALMLLAALYDKAEFLNVLTDFTIDRQKDGKQKANPKGAGKTLLRDDWMRAIRDKGVPQSEAGAWIRPNPVKQYGTGTSGALCDADVTSFRFCLLESDDLPFYLQLSMWARLPLPIAAIIDSGGRSAHAWVLLDCSTAEEYQAKVNRIFALLARFRICHSNKNPSRLSRLPGAQRNIGQCRDGMQRLLYLNPEPTEAPIFERGKSQCR